MSEDPRVAAARYRLEQLAGEDMAGNEGEERVDAAPTAPAASTSPLDPARQPTATDRAAYVETAIQQAIRRGDFDDLPGAGKPIPGLGTSHDPDWWIRRKIESEKLTGLGPPALTLRVESAELDARLDALARETDVRDALEDFNRRVRHARMQLQGGPPVVTPLRDVDAEIAAWRSRRDEKARRVAEAEAAAVAVRDAVRRRPFGRRRRRSTGADSDDA
ncbi:DUF1992 domain-containing protein [Microbacterium hominis]|uniref:DUF1992 domain-containing protein n=1 Tax=Microbacterium hominis TaxID=162426 RepID=A0A7D4UCA3_9MICO|nr:DUF1992 domain-containing protein [Microbacterium hominis]QKJ20443.1 DUF1992 domain-containing protein [Microbacterium hominis]